MNKDEVFMREAIKESKKALKRGDWPVGCVIVRNGEIVSRGSNKVYSKDEKISHAEMNAMRKISRELIGNRGEYTLYTTVEPCPMCLGAALLHHIRRIVFGIKDIAGSCHFIDNLPVLFKEEQYRLEVEGGILAEDCYEIFCQGDPAKKTLSYKNFLLK